MTQGRSILKKIILLDLVIVIYVVLSSTVIDYRSEQRVTSVLVDQVMEWNYRYFGIHKQVIDREKRLSVTADENIITKLKGRILMQVESSGEIWYLNPVDSKRYYIGKARDVWGLMNNFSEEVSSDDFIQYNFFDKVFPEELKGKFIKVVSDEIRQFYVDPLSAQAIELDDVDNAWKVFKENGLGIKNEDIRKIPVGEI
jgi:hypothetical protein